MENQNENNSSMSEKRTKETLPKKSNSPEKAIEKTDQKKTIKLIERKQKEELIEDETDYQIKQIMNRDKELRNKILYTEIKNQKVIYEELKILRERKYCDIFIHPNDKIDNSYHMFSSWKTNNKTSKYTFTERMREIMFQVIWGIMVAQQEMNFMHRKLRPECIFIREARQPRYYCLINDENPNEKEIWECSYVEVKIGDFKKSRIEYEDSEGNEIVIGDNLCIYDEMEDKRKMKDIFYFQNIENFFDSFDIPHYEEVRRRLDDRMYRNKYLSRIFGSAYFSPLRCLNIREFKNNLIFEYNNY